VIERSVRIYRWLLRTWPAAMRARYADEMVRVFRDRARDVMQRRGGVGLALLWPAALLDVLRGALAERVRMVREARRGGPRAGGQPGTPHTAVRLMNGLWRDVRHGWRSLLRSPAFTVAAVLTMGLGIGANAAIFSVVRAVLLRPLPYAAPERLVLVWQELRQRNVTHFPTSPPDFQDYRQMSTTFADLAGAFTFAQSLSGDGDPVQIDVGNVTPNFFAVLGVRPIMGRDFVAEDAAPPPPPPTPVAGTRPAPPPQVNAIGIMSYELWQSRYGGDPSVVGRLIDLGGLPTEVVGIAPPGFELLMPAAAALARHVDVWVAARIDYVNSDRNNVFLRVIGRLKPGTTLRAAQSDMDRIAADLRSRFTVKQTAGLFLNVIPMHQDLVQPVRPVLLALMGAVGFLLLIACANVANLMLVRSTARERELAVRAAVGGSRWRLVRQTLVESVLVSGAGGLLGVVLALIGVRVLQLMQPAQLPRIAAIALDGTVLLYTGLAALTAAMVFGMVPALRASRPAILQVLREGGRTPGLFANRVLRNGVIVAEVALSLVLLIGAGLMVRTFSALQRLDPGFDANGVLTFNAPLPFGRYPTGDARRAFQDQLQQRLAALPGVQGVTAASPLPLDGRLFNGRWGTEVALTDAQAFRQANYRTVRPGYFETLRTPLVAGRTFTEADDQTAAAVVVVDEELAAMAFPGRSAVGERILVRVSTPEPVWVEIIGVVRHQRHESLATIGRETIYFTRGYAGEFGGLTWAVRTSGDAAALAPSVRDQVAALDPLLPVADLRPMSDLVAEAMAPARFALTLIGTFAIIALVLAAIGLYGVLAYAVRQRTAEIGVRMAFGAEESSILRMVVSQGLRLSLVGVVAGVLGAVGLTRAMNSLLVGVSATDPMTYLGVALLFLAVAGLASLVPALRAARVAPLEALRQE
jgi:putative ABC transport system permease protein